MLKYKDKENTLLSGMYYWNNKGTVSLFYLFIPILDAQLTIPSVMLNLFQHLPKA